MIYFLVPASETELLLLFFWTISGTKQSVNLGSQSVIFNYFIDKKVIKKELLSYQ